MLALVLAAFGSAVLEPHLDGKGEGRRTSNLSNKTGTGEYFVKNHTSAILLFNPNHIASMSS